MSNASKLNIDHDIYPVIVKRHNNLFYVICNTFNIVKSSDRIDDAYAKLIETRTNIINNLTALELRLPTNNSDPLLLNSPSKWINKIIIVTVIISLPFIAIVAINKITNKVERFSANISTSIKGKAISLISNPERVNKAIDIVATKLDEITPEEKKQMQTNIRKIAKFLQPMIAELEPLHKPNSRS